MASSIRKIVLPPFLVEMFKQHRTRQLDARLKAGTAWEDHDIVFCNVYGKYIDVSGLYRTFRKLLSDAGLPIMCFHDLRYSAATLLLTMGGTRKSGTGIIGSQDYLNDVQHI